jgi:hypothetical protein
MNRDTVIGLPDLLHKAQNEFYAGSDACGAPQLRHWP